MLPPSLLVRLIRMNDDALGEFLGRYISWALDMYLHAKQGAQAIAPYNPLAMAPFDATSALARLFGSVAGWRDGRGQAEAPAGAPPPPQAPDDMADLRRELEELKKEVRKKKRA
jgi:hypothetical protein